MYLTDDDQGLYKADGKDRHHKPIQSIKSEIPGPHGLGDSVLSRGRFSPNSPAESL